MPNRAFICNVKLTLLQGKSGFPIVKRALWKNFIFSNPFLKRNMPDELRAPEFFWGVRRPLKLK